MTIECPVQGCGRRFEDRDRASLITALGADLAAVEVNNRQEATTGCPSCGRRIELGLLMLEDDGVWRVSPFAGHADDVTLTRAPGGPVSYQRPAPAPRRGPVESGPAGETAPAERRIRERALAVLAGRAAGVAADARHEAVELALAGDVLDATEAAAARAWLGDRHGR